MISHINKKKLVAVRGGFTPCRCPLFFVTVGAREISWQTIVYPDMIWDGSKRYHTSSKIGITPDHVQITAPTIENFQPQKTYLDLKDINVPVGGGGIILIKKSLDL